MDTYITDEPRRKAVAWMEGWRCGAAFLPAPDDATDQDFTEGWVEGRIASQAARKVAEAKYGYKFLVIKPAEGPPA